MKISKRAISDLQKVIDTVETMISWGVGGSFYKEGNFEETDTKAIKSAERGLDIIRKILSENK